MSKSNWVYDVFCSGLPTQEHVKSNCENLKPQISFGFVIAKANLLEIKPCACPIFTCSANQS